MIDTAPQMSQAQLALETQHRIPCPREHSIAARVGATAPPVIATIDFDHQRDCGRQEVDDVVPDDSDVWRAPTSGTREYPARCP
jgi:hypothetical protein